MAMEEERAPEKVEGEMMVERAPSFIADVLGGKLGRERAP
jgi:hypothetical protein